MATALTLTDGLIHQTEGFAVESDISTALQNYLPLAGGTMTGTLSINSSGGGPTGTLVINSMDGGNGANIVLSGTGASVSSPNKTLRSVNGNFDILNSYYSNVIFRLDDSGNVSKVNSLTLSAQASTSTQVPQWGQVQSWAQGQFLPLSGGTATGGIVAPTLSAQSTIFIQDQNNGNVAMYVNSGTYDFVIGSGNPSNRFFLVFSGETGVFTLSSNAKGSMDALPLSQAQTLFQPIISQYTVATLPSGAQTGAIAQVTDATNPVWHQTLVGGGSTLCNALFNGTSWVAT